MPTMPPGRPHCLTAPGLLGLPGVRHGFFTRQGLVGELNCAAGQTAESRTKALANRLLAARVLGGRRASQPVLARQVHGRTVLPVDGPWQGAPPEADGLVTRNPGVILGVLTADCAPVLLADAAAGVVGAAHAGWRGALEGVLEATVAAMLALGARTQRIHAAIGPCIGRDSYEVGTDFTAPFLARTAEDARFFRPANRREHLLFDLPGYTAARLAACGVTLVDGPAGDTLASPDLFYSYRYGMRQGGDSGGRQLSAIMLTETAAG